MHRSTDLLRTLDRLARERGWTRAKLATYVGLHRSTFVHAAAGRRVLTTQAIARICRALPEVPELKDLFWDYVRYEIPLGSEENGILPSCDEPASTLPERERDQLLGYVRAFPTRFVEGRGLIVVAGESRTLSEAASLVETALTSAEVGVARRLATDPIHSSEMPNLDRARLLVLERVDFAKPPARALLAVRLQRLLPVAITTATADLVPSLGEVLARALQAHCETVTLPAASHG